MYKKNFGQNFLINNVTAEKIIDLTNIKNENVIEIGPGNLALSKIIIKKKPKNYIAIEVDKSYYKKYKNFFFNNNYKIINEDALKIDETSYFKKEKFIIISNLPFNISSQLLLKWLKIKSHYNQIKKMILMFQKELADRIVATNNSKYYGRLSVITSAFFKTKNEIFVEKNEFSPMPKVDASVVVFDPLEKDMINYNNFKKLEDLTFSFFNSRRKKNKKKILKFFSEAQIQKYKLDKFYDLRPENIDPITFYKMCKIKN